MDSYLRDYEDRLNAAYEPIKSNPALSKWVTDNPAKFEELKRAGLGTTQVASFIEDRVRNEAERQSIAARADPYSAKRDQLVNDPAGALENNPFFKYLQEKYIASVTASNAAKGLRNSGRGMMAIGEAGQKAASGFYFPYLQSLGRPETGANTYLNALSIQDRQNGRIVSGGGGGSMRQPQQQQQRQETMPAPAFGQPRQTPAATSALPYSNGTDPSQMTLSQLLASDNSSAGSGTGYVVSDYGTTQFMPNQYGGQASTYQSAAPQQDTSQQYADYGGYSDFGGEADYGGYY